MTTTTEALAQWALNRASIHVTSLDDFLWPPAIAERLLGKGCIIYDKGSEPHLLTRHIVVPLESPDTHAAIGYGLGLWTLRERGLPYDTTRAREVGLAIILPSQVLVPFYALDSNVTALAWRFGVTRETMRRRLFSLKSVPAKSGKREQSWMHAQGA